MSVSATQGGHNKRSANAGMVNRGVATAEYFPSPIRHVRRRIWTQSIQYRVVLSSVVALASNTSSMRLGV